MTTLAAVQGDGWVVVGYDSYVGAEGGRRYTLPNTSGKVVENAGYILGVAGDFRAINILAHSFNPPDAGKKQDVELDRFMISRFVPALRKCFIANEYGSGTEFGATILVAVNGVAYEVGGNYDCLRDQRGLYALGSGSEFALGALSALIGSKDRTVSSAKRHINTAVGIAISYDPGSSRPISSLVHERSW